MNYDNITKENFKEYKTDFFKVIDEVEYLFTEHHYQNSKRKDKTVLVDSEGNDLYKKSMDAINIGFSKLFKFSHKNNIYFVFCSSIVYENTFNDRYKDYENEFIDVKKNEFIESEYYEIINDYYDYDRLVKWGIKEYELFINAKTKKLNFLENLLLENNCTITTNYNAGVIYAKRNILVEITEHNKQTQQRTRPQQIETIQTNSLNWQGTPIQFTELTKALFETKLISPEITQKEFFKRMKQFFNVKDFDDKERLKGIRARSKDLTPFINILETSLNNWIKNKD
jgi:hypothetical protein